MNSDPTANRNETRRGSTARASRGAPEHEEEELETGEPIPGEGEPMPVTKKIPSRRGKPEENPLEPPADETAPGGQMVLSTAKYLGTYTGKPNFRKGNKPECEPGTEKSGRSLEGHLLNSGVGGGILAMIGAVVWFIAGLMNGVLFFYPPILFVIGLGAFFKGLTRQE
jgi:hypothetical protein